MNTKNSVILKIEKEAYHSIWSHLLPGEFKNEEAAFIYARHANENGNEIFCVIDYYLVPPEKFDFRSGYHFELADEIRGKVIKHAHDLNTSLIELHSHLGTGEAQFSPSDAFGFKEFVPHVWWRLKKRPYAAIVVNKYGFDGFAWITGPHTPVRLEKIIIGDEQTILPSCLSPKYYDYDR